MSDRFIPEDTVEELVQYLRQAHSVNCANTVERMWAELKALRAHFTQPSKGGES